MKRVIKTCTFCLLIVALLSVKSIVIAEGNNLVNVIIDGVQVVFNDDLGFPFIDENNRTLVPFRATLETIGATVSWDQESNMAIAEKNMIKVQVPIGQKYILKNGEKIEIDTVVQIRKGRTYLPIRAVLEAFGYEVGWDGKTRTVLVNKLDDLNKGEIVVFEDKNLENYIRKIINKPEGEIYSSDLVNIRELSMRDSNIRSLEGIQYVVNLEKLDIYNNLVSDLSPIKSLDKLKYIDFQFNLVSDISPVNGKFSGYGNPVNNTFSIEEKMEEIKEAFYFGGKTREAYEMAKALSEITGSDVKVNFDSWNKRETENFVFYFQPSTKVTNIDEFVQAREQAFKKINSIFKAKLPKKIDFFVWNSNEDALKEIGRTLGFAISSSCTIHSRYEQTLGHKMTHIIVGNAGGFYRATGLINEGLATYFDQTNQDKLLIAKEALRKSKNLKISIKDLWLNWPGEMIGEFHTYPLAAAFVKYLIQEEGIDKVLELAKNQTYENALNIYGGRIDELITEFEKLLYD